MIYSLLGVVISVVFSIRAASFAVWQFKNKNILGAFAVFSLSLLSVILSFLQLNY